MATSSSINSISALKLYNDSSPLPGDTFSFDVQGYSSAGDGGGGTFAYVATDTTGGDDGTIIVDLQGRRWHRVYNGDINIRWFGVGIAGGLSAPAGFAAAFAIGNKVIVPAIATITLTSVVSVPDGKALENNGIITNGTAPGAMAGGFTFAGSASVSGSGSFINQPLTFLGGTITVNGPSFSGTGPAVTTMILIKSGVFTNCNISGCNFTDCNYGILRQGTGSSATNFVINGNTFYNMHADAVEWNQAVGDSGIIVSNNTIDLIHGSPNDWGIAIGFAGLTYTTNYDEADSVKDFMIFGNLISRVPQGIHVECGKRGMIFGNKLKDVSTSYTGLSTLPAIGIVVYGSYDIAVHDNVVTDSTCSYPIAFQDGALSSTYINPNAEISIKNNITKRNIRSTTPFIGATNFIQFGGTGAMVTVSDNESDTAYEFRGLATMMTFSRNNILTVAGANQLTVDLNPAGFPGLATGVTTLVMENNLCIDANGVPQISLTNVAPRMLRSSGNNFQVNSGALPTVPTQNVYKVATGGAAGAGVFPYGMEFLLGDEIVDTDSATRWTVTTAGSRNRPTDTCAVYNNTTNTLRSTNLPWTVIANGGQHFAGQKITISNIGPSGAALVTSVVRVYIGSGFYLMDVADPISAVNGTTGVITATNPVAFVAI